MSQVFHQKVKSAWFATASLPTLQTFNLIGHFDNHNPFFRRNN